ncbi:MAG: CRISPR-associated endonuclease Cas6 [Bacteroidia bacterium]|nr:CRISPR-associated endonuclease Cas6 [Bacteroidia bacterium]
MSVSHKLKILRVVFGGELAEWEIPAFRGGVAQKVGLEHVLFHNHEGGQFRYRYPLIQYKTARRHPVLLCLGEGVEEAHKFFQQRDWSLSISGRTLEMKIENMELFEHTFALTEHMMPYLLNRWVALNQKNHHEFELLRTDEERYDFLERKLTGNILSLAKGIGWRIEGTVQSRITALSVTRSRPFKGMQFYNFRANILCNIALPAYIGLGAKVSQGYGTLYPADARFTADLPDARSYE